MDQLDRKVETIPISIFLRPGRARLLFCMICREDFKMQIEGFPRLVVPGDASSQQGNYRPLVYPIKIRCRGRSQIHGKCPALWIIQGYIEE